ncbi:MAG: phosphoribosyltransferase [Nitrososphaerales archaeon]
MSFKDRVHASLQLAQKLTWLKDTDTIVLAIPRGGLVIGEIIAKSLDARLDVVVPRKLGAPSNPELAIGAVMHDGSSYLNNYVINALNIDKEYIKYEIGEQVREIERRLVLYRKSKDYDLENMVVILVDDGIATGATMMVAISWVKRQKPKMVVLATPVAPRDVAKLLEQRVDKMVILMSPFEFGAVGEFYEDFSPVSDAEVVAILQKYK